MTGGSPLVAYEPIVGGRVLEDLHRLGREAEGTRVLMVSAGRHTGGVSESISRLVPLLNDIGVRTEWKALNFPSDVYEAGRLIRDGLQGERVELTGSARRLYEASAARYREELDTEPFDVVVVHGQQPCGLVGRRRQRARHGTDDQAWVWRCHYDVSRPDRRTWRFMRPMIELYDASVYSTPSFARHLTPPHRMYTIAPSIDPLSPKNEDLDDEAVQAVLDRLGVPRDLPILLQVSRFDRHKDPLGVIESWRMVDPYRACRLVIAGGIADDDPDGEEVLGEVEEAAAGEERVHVLRLPFDAHHEINALQRAAQIVVQKSTKEGFGISVTEAMYKSRPVIGGAVDGIRAQVRHGRTGYLAHSIAGAAHRIRYLLHRPTEAWRMGKLGREVAIQQFLITRHLRDYLLLLVALKATGRRRVRLMRDGQLVT